MRRVAVIGVGMTLFGKQPERSLEDLGREAIPAALHDAGLERDRIGAAYCANALGGGAVGQRVLADIGIGGLPVVNVEAACASGSVALHEGWLRVAAGMHDVVLVFGVEKLSDRFDGVITLDRGHEPETKLGLTMPASYAFIAQRHMVDHGTTREQLALVSVKNHKHGVLNPKAQYRTEFSVEEVLTSRMIADPLTLYQCCANSDGAAAVVLVAEDAIRDSAARPVWIRGTGLSSGTSLRRFRDMSYSEMAARAARAAYAQAGISPEDVGVAEVHDAFTIGEMVACEALGFCERGRSGALVETGEAELSGRIPVNPSGGLLSKGHPVGATGVAQIVELAHQLRGEAGRRQVEGARIGVAHTLGGGVAALDGVACAVTVLGV
ncbi:MAG: thiolase family protein [Thermoleophilia bacterium]